MKKQSLFLVFFFVVLSLSGQGLRPFSVGLEAQVYPTGFIPGVRIDWQLADQGMGHLRIGANIIDHQDFGEQDEEIGEGFGFSLGYQHYFRPSIDGFFLGARCDLWWNTLDWQNDINSPHGSSGTSNITVVQPTFLAGYAWVLGGGWEITPTLGYGVEINVITNGEPIGQGTIALGGLTLAKRI